MPIWLTAFVATLWALVGPVVNSFLAYYAGKAAQNEKDKADASAAQITEFKAVKQIDDANRSLTDSQLDDKLR